MTTRLVPIETIRAEDRVNTGFGVQVVKSVHIDGDEVTLTFHLRLESAARHDPMTMRVGELIERVE